jgi:predicted O-methyltransferase YrrM
MEQFLDNRMSDQTMEINGLICAKPELHNGAIAKQQSMLAKALHIILPWKAASAFIAVSTAPGRWGYALSFPVNVARLHRLSNNDAVIVECRVRVHEGRLGVGLIAEDGSTFVSTERAVAAEPAARTLRIWIREPARARHLVFRNVEPDGKPIRFDVLDISAHVLPSARTFAATWSDPSVNVIGGAELGRMLEWAQRIWDMPFPRKAGDAPKGELGRMLEWAQRIWDMPFPRKAGDAPKTASIDVVDVDDLPSVLGMHTPPELPSGAKDKPLADWKMETDDAPILQSIWRAWAPRRHLEFGTWEGFGAVLVAQNTSAEIWTLNLPEGEAAIDGTSLYASTDAVELIGWKYQAAGVAARVHQILCDSRNFDTGAFAADFFDTVLIDGGHTPDIVENDTEKALRLLRPGGLCVWHDFCPDPDVLSRNLAPFGVVQAIAENIDRWRPLFDRFYWIRRSWILVGERNAASIGPKRGGLN